MININMKYMVLSNMKANSSMKLLYCYMLDLDKDEIIASYSKIGREIRMKRNTVGRNLRKLRDAGMIKIQSRYSEDGARLSNKFILY